MLRVIAIIEFEIIYLVLRSWTGDKSGTQATFSFSGGELNFANKNNLSFSSLVITSDIGDKGAANTNINMQSGGSAVF